MKKLFKKVLSALLTIVMVLTVIPLSGVTQASAAFDNKDTSYNYPIRSISNTGRGFTSGEHKGIDLTMPKGTAVYSAKNGTVVKIYSGCSNNNGASKTGTDCKKNGCTSGSYYKMSSDDYKTGYYCNGGFGNGIVIKNDDGKFCHYAHLSKINVKVNDKVTPNTKIGEVGSTGCSTGAHLHFGISNSKDNNGTYYNPFSYIFPGFKITLKNNGSSSVNPRFQIDFAWKDFEASKCKIFFGTSSSALNSTAEDNKFTSANCYYDLGKKFGNLTKGKTYYIKVSVTKNGTTSTSPVYSFVAGGGDKTFLNYTSVASTGTSTTTTYTVSYNANGGSGAPSAQIKTKGANLTLSSVVPTRSGYDFKGWATSAGGAVAYNAGGTYKTDASVTLYAVWAARPVMPSVTLKAESDITKNSAVVNFEIKNPSKLLITASGVQIRKKGNTDWQNPFNEDISAKTEFNKNASIPGKFTIGSGKEVNFALSEGTTYEYRCYCVYNGTKYYSDIKTFTTSGTTAAQTYTVSYNANGGSGAPSAQTKTKGVNLTLSRKVPTRSGYDFKGWATSAGGAVAYNAGGTYKTDASVTLYAVWAVHQHSYTSRVTKVQTCTEDGEEIYTCSKCNESYVKVIPATGHNDADGNGYCDSCNTYIAQCDCICHTTGFMGFIYFIVRFIWRITGTNPVCNCGARHY